MTEDLLAGNPIVYVSNLKEQVREVFEQVKTLQLGRKMVMLHGDAGEIVGYDRIPFPESDMKRKALIIENFSGFEDAFFLAYTPTIRSGISINHLIFYNMYHVQT